MARGLNRRSGILVSLIVIVALVGLLLGAGPRYSRLDQAIQIMAQVKMRYLEQVSLSGLFRAYLKSGTIDGMLASLHDPYTRYLKPAEYTALRTQTEGTFGGIGVILNYRDKTIVIMKALNGSPGEAAGLCRGDRIVKVNGRTADRMSADEAVAAIRGPAGTTVRLGIERGEGAAARTFELKITRANIKLPSVEWEIIDDRHVPIGFLTLMQFGERTSVEIEEALDAADRARVRGLILDLRYNPGGLLDAAISVSSKFLDGGVVMYMVKRGEPRQPFYAERSLSCPYPVVVLVNQWSASASEIVAGALQDRGVAILVGVRTFGKGLVQEIVPLAGGAALSVTVAKYLTAGGRSINKVGIEPNVVADIPGVMERAMKTGQLEELVRLERLQRDRALEVLHKQISRQMAAAS